MADRKVHFSDLNRFMRWLCINLSRELGMANQIDHYWDEEGMGSKVSCSWKKLRLAIVHATDVYIQLNINQSPFNVGVPIQLPEFTTAQAHTLAQQHGLSETLDLAPLMDMVDSMGLIKLSGNIAEPRCQLYHQYFQAQFGVGS